MYKKVRRKIVRNLINFFGWPTDRKIVVIESDDWGMVRMASKEAYKWFLKKGYKVDQCPYNRNDALECNSDLEQLIEVLSSVKDKFGNAAIFTLNNVVANPDFEKIKESKFQQYYLEPFTDTLKRYPQRDRVLELYKQGIAQNIFHPQFHGREHLNVNRWMSGLISGDKILHDAFKQNMFTVHQSGSINCRRDHLDAFGMGYENEWVQMDEVIKEGLNLFEDLWGYRSLSFVAPCYIWSEKNEEVLSEYGVKYIQGTHVQRVPVIDQNYNIKKKYHCLGQENRFGQKYLIRNVNFEPTENGRTGLVDKALKEIELSFKYKKPAIISSHRVNYIGSIRAENRDKNLKLLSSLLQRIVNEYPEVEFMSSEQLGSIINEEN